MSRDRVRFPPRDLRDQRRNRTGVQDIILSGAACTIRGTELCQAMQQRVDRIP